MIKVNKINKYYGVGDNRIHALKDCSFDIAEGTITAFVGTSGSGKTTLLNIIGGLLKADSGSVECDSTDITKLSDRRLLAFRRKNIGYVYQSFMLLPELTAEENIKLPVYFGKNKPDEKLFDKLTDALGIKDRLTHKPQELSGGQQQRIAIARAMMTHPKILLCDEPTGNLDSDTSKSVVMLLNNLRDQFGQTILIVTHDQSVAEKADEIYRIEDGRLYSL